MGSRENGKNTQTVQQTKKFLVTKVKTLYESIEKTTSFKDQI